MLLQTGTHLVPIQVDQYAAQVKIIVLPISTYYTDKEIMKSYFRVMLGVGSRYAEECETGSFIEADFDIYQNLSDELI